MATELEKLLQTALDKALKESASGQTDILKSFSGLAGKMEVLQRQVQTLTEQQQASTARELALTKLCSDLAAQLEALSTKLNTIKR